MINEYRKDTAAANVCSHVLDLAITFSLQMVYHLLISHTDILLTLHIATSTINRMSVILTELRGRVMFM